LIAIAVFLTEGREAIAFFLIREGAIAFFWLKGEGRSLFFVEGEEAIAVFLSLSLWCLTGHFLLIRFCNKI
jgi:hypothetical protein